MLHLAKTVLIRIGCAAPYGSIIGLRGSFLAIRRKNESNSKHHHVALTFD